jgi:hypothetical protein
LPNNRPKRQRPKAKRDRRRLCEVNRQLNLRGTTPERRADLEAERDRISPVLLPPTREDLDQLIGRVEDSRNGSPLPDGGPEAEGIPSTGTPPPTSPVEAAQQALARKLDAARVPFDAQIKAKELRIDDRLTAIAEQHARFGYELWTGRQDWDHVPFDGKAVIVTCQLKAWRNKPVSEHPTWQEASWVYFLGLPAMEKLRQFTAIRKSFAKTTPEQRADIFKRLNIEKRMHEPLPERLLNREPEEPAEPETPDEELVIKPEPAPDPIIQANLNIAEQADLVLRVIDPQFLGRVAQHSPTLDSQIRAAVANQLLAHGNCDNAFLLQLYNALRPRLVSAFPPRNF